MTINLQSLLRALGHTIHADPKLALAEGQAIATTLTPAIVLARVPANPSDPFVTYVRADPQDAIDTFRGELALLAAHPKFYQALAASLPRA